jgi:hypothetical protein
MFFAARPKGHPEPQKDKWMAGIEITAISIAKTRKQREHLLAD